MTYKFPNFRTVASIKKMDLVENKVLIAHLYNC